ncbi:hypothetical protein IJG14_00015, partial [bacterium]|nr:hypothetical protein [bacterium]
MQIYEIKKNTAEILYSPKESNLFLSDFLYIDDDNYTVISQIVDIRTTDNHDVNIANVKFYLSVDKKNNLSRYNGYIPSKNADVGYLDAKEIIDLFKPKYNEIIWGKYLRNTNLTVSTDLKFLSSGFGIICDRLEQSNIIVQNIINSFKKRLTRFVLLDFEGKYTNINTDNNLVYGSHYRIPLDSLALDYIFENELNEYSFETKSILQNIILSVQKYVESSNDNFIPFETFVNIFVSESKDSRNPELMMFCNKLLKYKQRKIFADSKQQVGLTNKIGGSFKIDLSQIDEEYYPLIFKSIINDIKKKFYVISDITNSNIVQNTIKYIYDKSNIRLIPIFKHNNQYLTKIKENICNWAIFPSSENSGFKEKYNSFLDEMANDEFILCGDNTLSIPLIISLQDVVKEIQEENCLNTNEDISITDLDELDKLNIAIVKEYLQQEQNK